jgi:hypothetical protein
MADAEPAPFSCSCGAKYKIVRVEAPPGPTTDRQIVCLSCGGPLNGREVAFLLKVLSNRASKAAASGPMGSMTMLRKEKGRGAAE